MLDTTLCLLLCTNLNQMESAIRPCYSPPLPSVPLHLSSTDARVSKFHLRSSNHASLCCVTPHFSKSRLVSCSFGRVNCMLDRFPVPSKDEETSDDNKIMRGVTGISLVLACVIGVFNFSGKMMNPKFNNTSAYASWCSGHSLIAMAVPAKWSKPLGGERALNSLLKMINAEPASKKTTLHDLPRPPSQRDIDELKLKAVSICKAGKADEVLKKLEKEYDNVQNHSEEKHFLGMALVELYMFQRNFEKALRLLDSLIDEQISSPERLDYKRKIDALLSDKPLPSKYEFLLYKAIVHTMLGNNEAAEWGKAFRSTLT